MSDECLIDVMVRGQGTQLAEIHQASFSDSNWTSEQLCSTFNLETTQGLTATVNNEMVGFILFQLTEDNAEVLTFCVHPKMQRHKIGEALLEQTIMIATSRKVSSVFLEVAADNIPACGLYQKLGFKVIGKRPGYYKHKNGPIDALTYELRLFASVQ